MNYSLTVLETGSFQEPQGSGHSVSRAGSLWKPQRRMHSSDCSAYRGYLCSLTQKGSHPLVLGSQSSLPCTCKDNCGCMSGSEIIQNTSFSESIGPYKATLTDPMVSSGHPETEVIFILLSCLNSFFFFLLFIGTYIHKPT